MGGGHSLGCAAAGRPGHGVAAAESGAARPRPRRARGLQHRSTLNAPESSLLGVERTTVACESTPSGKTKPHHLRRTDSVVRSRPLLNAHAHGTCKRRTRHRGAHPMLNGRRWTVLATE